eukprot:s66_g35.t1
MLAFQDWGDHEEFSTWYSMSPGQVVTCITLSGHPTLPRVASEKGRAAAQRQIFLEEGRRGARCFNLVAELRLFSLATLLIAVAVGFWLEFGSGGGRQLGAELKPDFQHVVVETEQQTTFTTILASSTAKMERVVTTATMVESSSEIDRSMQPLKRRREASAEVVTTTLLHQHKSGGSEAATPMEAAPSFLSLQSDVGEHSLDKSGGSEAATPMEAAPSFLSLQSDVGEHSLNNLGADGQDELSLFEQSGMHNGNSAENRSKDVDADNVENKSEGDDANRSEHHVARFQHFAYHVKRDTDPRHDPWWYETLNEEYGVLDLGTSTGVLGPLDHDSSVGLADNRSLSWHNGSYNNGSYNGTDNSTGDNRTWFSGMREMLWVDPRKLSSMCKSIHAGSLTTVQWTLKHRLHLLMVMLGSSLICAAIAMMQPGRNPGGGPWRGQQPFHQDVGAATLKTPPSWSHEQSNNYSLRAWLSDIAVWSAATDVEVERQAAAAVLQIHGMARDLVREIPAQQLRDGVWEGNMHIPGLMLVCRTLAQRFAPLESELQTRTMSELMNFQRLPGESIDSSLTRFEVLRHRVGQRGGLVMNATSQAYLLLNGLRLHPQQWDRALLPIDGQLPMNEMELNQLMDRLRRVGRLQEGHFGVSNRQGATGEVGAYYFPMFDATPTPGGGLDGFTYYGNNGPQSFQPQQPQMQPDMPGSSGLIGQSMQSSFPAMPNDEVIEDQCTRCGMYYEDEFSSSTESDVGDDDSEAGQLYAHYNNDPSLLGNVLYGDYMLAKQRWRRFSGRPPRRYRRGHFNKYHQKNNYQKLQRYGKTYASFLPPNAFAAHRGPGGKSKGKGKSFPRQNPRGKDGQVLKCHRCGSTEHLIRKCPQAESSGQSHAMSMLSRPLADVTGASSVKRANSVIDDLESIRSIASSKRRAENPGSEVQSETASPARPMYPPPLEPAPSAQDLAVSSGQSSAMMWTSVKTGLLSNVGSESGSLVGRSSSDVNNVLAGISFRSSSTVHGSGGDSVEGTSSGSKSRRKTGGQDERQQRMRDATTLQLSELLAGMGRMNQPFSLPQPAVTNRALTYASSQASEPKATDASPDEADPDADNAGYHPWWETVDPSVANTSHVNNFHSLRTCNSSGLVGLLVDPGAHDNLAGEATMRRLEQQLESRAVMKRLDHPLSVSGVGKSSQQADRALSVEFQLSNTENNTTRCSYTAPVIPNSEFPPLLGLRSLQSKRAVLDTHGKLLILPGPGGLEIKCSPGSQILQLEASESGHLLLPMQPLPEKERGRSGASTILENQRLDFQVQCRTTRTPSPVRGATPPPRGPYQMPEQDLIITGRSGTTGGVPYTSDTMMTTETVAVPLPHRTRSSAPVSPPKAAPATRSTRLGRSADAAHGRSAPYR